MRTQINAGDGDPRHGTSNGYVNLKCRCDDCRRAWAVYQRGHEKQWRARNYARGLNARGKPYKSIYMTVRRLLES